MRDVDSFVAEKADGVYFYGLGMGGFEDSAFGGEAVERFCFAGADLVDCVYVAGEGEGEGVGGVYRPHVVCRVC